MAWRCVPPAFSNATIAAGGVLQRPRRHNPSDSDDPGGFGGSNEYPNPNQGLWSGYHSTQYAHPLPPASASESHGPGDGSVRRIMAAGFRDTKKSMAKTRIKERACVRIKDLLAVRTKKAWMITLPQDVVLASGRADDDVVVDWLRMSIDTFKSWSDFIDSGERCTTLDLKLAEGLLIHFRDD